MTIQEQILDTIRAYETIIIHRHQRPDPDAYGSQMGLKYLLQAHFPEKRILATGFSEPSLTWLAEMDEVITADYEGALVIVTDTANAERIDGMDYHHGAFIIKIDHHPNDEPYGDVMWVDTEASSTSEMVAEWADRVQLSLTDRVARLLYAGIVGDTGRFLYPNTSSKTLACAAWLREYDFDAALLGRQMESFSYAIAKLQGFVYDRLEVDANGAARVVLSRQVLEEFGLTDSETAAIVSAPGKIDSVSAWAIFVEQADGSYRVRLRSKTIPINNIAKRHGGGGHPLASGANSYSLEENEQIYRELQEAVAHGTN